MSRYSFHILPAGGVDSVDTSVIPPTGMGLSERGIPFLVVAGHPMLPHQFLKRMFATWNWKLSSRHPYYHLKIGGHAIKLHREYFHIIFSEWLDWKRTHLPPFSLKGATILDVGAGCGETALFYFIHGVDRVICVEPNSDLSNIIRENSRANRWNVEILARPFDVGMLNLKIDFMKMDCEGCEAQLLSADKLPNCVMEVHDGHVLEGLTSKFGLSVAKVESNGKRGDHNDFERRHSRMYYLGWRFTRAREKLHKARGLSKLYYAIILVILELHPDFINVYRARWGRVWEAYYFPYRMNRIDGHIRETRMNTV